MCQGGLRYHEDARWRALDRGWAETLAGDAELLELIRPQLHHSVQAMQDLLARFDADANGNRRQHALLLLAMSYGTRVLRRYDPDAVSPQAAADLLAAAARAVLQDLERDDGPLTGSGEAPTR